MKNVTLSPMAKRHAQVLAAQLEIRTHLSSDHPNGFATEQTRKELMEIVRLLESKAQPHRGLRRRPAVANHALALEGIGMAPRKAARYALAYAGWSRAFSAARTKADKAELQAELDGDLKARCREVTATDAKRVAAEAAQLKKDGVVFVFLN